MFSQHLKPRAAAGSWVHLLGAAFCCWQCSSDMEQLEGISVSTALPTCQACWVLPTASTFNYSFATGQGHQQLELLCFWSCTGRVLFREALSGEMMRILLPCYKHKANFSLVSCSTFCGLLAMEPCVTSQTKLARLRDLLMIGFQVGKAICQSIRNLSYLLSTWLC